MEADECEPVAVDGFWSPAQTKTVQKKLQLYFGSKKKSSGGDCRVEAEDGAPRAAVYFSSEEVRQRVLARANHEIIVDNQTIQLRLTPGSRPANNDDVSDSQTPKSNAEAGNVSENKDESVQSVAVVLENVVDDKSRDLLVMLVENISGLDDNCFSLEIIWESNRAVITFNNAADVEKFLTVGQSSQKLQKQGLTARPLEAAESVRVESLPPTVVKDMLELYFEKNWALPDRIMMIPEEQAAIVTFKHPKVVENICTKRDYVMGSIPVKVYPYHEALGSALYGRERPAWKMPEPFTEKVHHVVWKFLQMKNLFQNINDQMCPYFCSVDLNNNEVKLSPLPGFLRQKGLTAERVSSWMSTTLDAFRQQMSQYTAFECEVNADAWKAAEKDVRSVVKDNAVLVMDASRDTLTVAGQADDMKQLRAPVEDIVRKAIIQIKRQTDAVSEGMALPPAMFYILKQEGLKKAAQDISPDMSLSYDAGTQMITITGLPAEVYQTKSWILEKKVGMSKKRIDVPPGLLDFLKTVDPMDMSQDLFTSQGITAIYGIEDKGVMLLGSSDRVLAEAESKMTQVLSLQTLDVEDQEVLKRHNWMSLNQQLLDTYNSSKKKTVTIQIHPDRRNKITVAGFVTPVKEISSSLREFIVNYSQVQETIRVKSGAVVQFIDKKKGQDWTSIAKANDVKAHFVSDSQTPKSNAEAGNVSENKDESVQSVAVVLENVADDKSRDLLVMLVENISGLDDNCFSLEIIWESNRAVITFNNAADVEKFLTVGQSSQKLQKYGLTARPLEAAESVRVESLPPTVVKDMLELYFEKNWALPDRITMIPEELAAIVTFKHPKVVENICTKRDYMMGSIPVKVYPYHESLGSALYGRERPAWKMPEPFTEKVHHVVWKFLQMKNLFQNINDQMRPYFCSVDLNNEVKLSPLPGFLRQKGLTAERVSRWMSTTLDAFRQQMSQYTAFECEVNADAWKAAEKDVRSVVKDNAVLVMDASRDTLTVAGQADDMKQLRAPVEDIVRKAIIQIKRQTDAVSEGMALPPAMFYILKQEGLKKAAQDISPDMSLSYDAGTQMITITGLPAEVYQTKSWILEKKVGMSKKRIDVPPGLLDFLKTVDPMDMSQDLFTSQGITAIYGIEDKGVMLLGSSDRVLAEAESKMTQVLSLQTLDVEDQEVLKRHNWMSLNQQLLDTYNSSKKKTVTIQIHPDRRNKITVAGFLTPVIKISSSLREFIVNYSQVQETIRVKSGAVVQFIDKKKGQDWTTIAKANDVKVHFDEERPKIIIAGARVHVQKAKSCFLEMTGALSTDNFTVDKPGAKKYFLSAGRMVLSTMMSELSCVVILRPDNQPEEEEENYEGEDVSCYCKVRTASGVLVSVSKADICRFSVDAVVNAANEELQHIGGLALLLQKVSNDYVSRNRNLRPGEAIVTRAFNLPCKHVVHAVGPRFSDFDQKTSVSRLKLAVKESLRQAEKVNCSTVALPAISSGVFGFPVDLCADTIAQSVREYCDSPGSPRTLTEIHLVDNNHNTVRVLATAVNTEFNDLGPTLTIPQPAGGRGAGASGYQRGQGQNQVPRDRGFGERGGGQRGGGARWGGAGSRGGWEGDSGDQNLRGPIRPGGHGGLRRAEQTTAEGLKTVLWRRNIQDQTRFTREFSGQTGQRVIQHEAPEFNESPVVQSVRQPQQNSDKITSIFPASGPERLNAEALVLEREEFEPTVLQLCADNDKAVSQAKRRIQDLIVAEQAERTITDSFISHLSRADMDQLSALQRKLTVSIRLEKGLGDQEPKIHLEGLTRDVFTAESEVRDIIKKVERSENLRNQAFLVSGLVEWKYQQLDGTMVSFDIHTNLQLEGALGKKQSVKIMINNQPYTADVKFKKAVSANGRKEVELQRKDLKAADDAALPSNWDDMKSDRLKLFPLTVGSSEYTDVEKQLRRTGLRVNIIKIERVQNISLWKSYQQVKTDLEVKNQHTNNERQLFHGTGPNSIDLINKQGFNRSYAGQHAAMYGNGSYFLVDPAYSARGYAKPDASGQKRMYLARVLVGDFTQGRGGMITLPSRNTGNAADLYNSVVDNTTNPTMFIVFTDTQAYPEYLITFT